MAKQTVLITGCSDGGIGPALAVLFQRRGFHVFATARDPSKMKSLSGVADVTFLALDVTKTADIEAAVCAVSDMTGGTLDCLVSNAGRNHFMPILDERLDVVREIFETNLLGPMALTHAFAPLLIKAKGMAVYNTSICGYVNIPYMGSYAASKRALEIVADTLRLELAPFGVGVLSIVTGIVKSRGQSYFGELRLPPESLYKSIEAVFVSRAQGYDGYDRMDTMEYAEFVVDKIIERTTGRIWCGEHAEQVRMNTVSGNAPQHVIDAEAAAGTGLDALQPK